MTSYIKIAWRNIWRNRRRTLITSASVFFAILLALVMRAMQLGTYDKMIKDVVEFHTGYLQIHAKGYWENKTINETFESNDSLTDQVKSVQHVTVVIPRLESFALASSGPLTKGVMIVGTDPEEENRLTHLQDKVIKGDYLLPKDNGVLLAQKLAGYLKLDVNDTLIMISQGYHGVSAAGKFPVRGIVKYPSLELNSQLVIMDISQCQEFFSAYNRLTSLALMIDDIDELEKVKSDLEATIDSGQDYRIMTWKEMMTDLVNQIESDNASGIIFLAILYMIVTFGIFGTIMMATAERRREFGVMISIGMRKSKLLLIIFFETLFIGIIGIISGIIASLPIIYYFHINPITFTGDMARMYEGYGFDPVMPFAWEPSFFINQSMAIIILTMIALIYPLVTVGRLDIVKALKS